jgi:hypothetical protein
MAMNQGGDQGGGFDPDDLVKNDRGNWVFKGEDLPPEITTRGQAVAYVEQTILANQEATARSGTLTSG